MAAFLQDLRFGIRLLFRHRTFTVVAALVLAFGIGANTAVFTLINSLILKPRPGANIPVTIVSHGVSPTAYSSAVSPASTEASGEGSAAGRIAMTVGLARAGVSSFRWLSPSRGTHRTRL